MLGHLGLLQLRLAVLLEQFHQQAVGTVRGRLQELLLVALEVQEVAVEEARAALEMKAVTHQPKALVVAVAQGMQTVVEEVVALAVVVVMAELPMVVMAESVLLALLTQMVLAKVVIQHQVVVIILLVVAAVENIPARMERVVLVEVAPPEPQEQAGRLTPVVAAVVEQVVARTLAQEQAVTAAPALLS